MIRSLTEILSKYDHEFDEATYDAIVTDIENQNLKDSTGKIKNICNIDTPVNPEKFRLNYHGLLTALCLYIWNLNR